MAQLLNSDVTMDAGELVERVLTHSRGGVETLVRLAGGEETEWLEFKAGLGPPPGKPMDKGENLDDYRWHVAKAVIALANTRGGAVILGINPQGKAIGLASSDPDNILDRKGREEFIRHLVDSAIRPKDGWKTGKEGHCQIDQMSLQSLLTPKMATFHGENVVVLLVRPVPEGHSLLEVEQTSKEVPKRRILLVRDLGEEGRVRSINLGDDTVHYHNDRVVPAVEYASLWNQFLLSTDDLEKAIATYHQKLKKTPIFSTLERVFTPLEAEEHPELMLDSKLLELEVVEDLIDEAWSDADDEEHLESEEEDDEEEELFETEKIPRRGGVFELMDLEPRLALLGEPGGGKTTCLQRRCLNSVRSYRPGGMVAIYVPLASYRVGEGLINLISRASRLPPGYLDHLSKSGRISLLLDALNECPSCDQDQCVGEIESLLRDLPGTPFVLSTRTLAWRQQLDLRVFTVQPLTRLQQEHFLSAYLDNGERAKSILNQLYAQPGGDIIANNPWMLRMIASITRDGQDLPRGRALMYRRYLHQWYEREAHKAKSKGIPFPWSKEEVLSQLAHLAAQMRVHGYAKEVPISWITKTLGSEWTTDNGLLECLGQGLICTMDREDNSFSFLHETLQEYLTAEYILKTPDLLKDIKQEAADAWDMPLAYAFELEENPSVQLIEAAWHINIFLVALTVGDPILLRCLPLPENISPFMKYTLHFLREEKRPMFEDKFHSKLPVPRKEDLAKLTSKVIEYLIHSHPTASKSFKSLKLDWINSHPSRIALFVGNNLIKKDDLPEQQLRRFLRSLIISDRKMKVLLELISADFYRNYDLPADIIQKLIKFCKTPQKAGKLIRAGFATKESFAEHLLSWFAKPKATKAVNLIQAGFAGKEDFMQYLPLWIKKSKPTEAYYLIQAGLAKKEDFAELLQRWIEQSTPKKAKQLIRLGLARKEDFKEDVPQWIKEANPRKAYDLIRAGLANKRDFTDRLPKWIAEATKAESIFLIQSYLARKEDFPQHFISFALTSSTPQLSVQQTGAEKTSDLMYTKEVLKDTLARSLLSFSLAGKRWIMTVKTMLTSYGFLEHPQFPDGVFFHVSSIAGPIRLNHGDRVEVTVVIQKNKKRGAWGYMATNMKPLQEVDNIDKEYTRSTITVA